MVTLHTKLWLTKRDTSSSEVCFHWPWNKAPCSWKQWVHLLPSTVPASSGPPGMSSLPIHIVLTKRKKMLTWICDRYNNIIFRNSYQHWKSFADTESSTSKLYSLHHLYLCQCVSQLKRWIGDLTDLIQADTSAVTERVRTWAEVRGENLGCKLTSYTSFGRCWLESTIIIHNW